MRESQEIFHLAANSTLQLARSPHAEPLVMGDAALTPAVADNGALWCCSLQHRAESHSARVRPSAPRHLYAPFAGNMESVRAHKRLHLPDRLLPPPPAATSFSPDFVAHRSRRSFPVSGATDVFRFPMAQIDLRARHRHPPDAAPSQLDARPKCAPIRASCESLSRCLQAFDALPRSDEQCQGGPVDPERDAHVRVARRRRLPRARRPRVLFFSLPLSAARNARAARERSLRTPAAPTGAYINGMGSTALDNVLTALVEVRALENPHRRTLLSTGLIPPPSHLILSALLCSLALAGGPPPPVR